MFLKQRRVDIRISSESDHKLPIVMSIENFSGYQMWKDRTCIKYFEYSDQINQKQFKDIIENSQKLPIRKAVENNKCTG